MAEPLKHSTRLTTRFFARVLAVYCAVTLAVTLIHAQLEFSQVREELVSKLDELKPLLVESLTSAIWQLDTEQVDRIVQGALDHAEVTGVRLLDEYGETLAAAGDGGDTDKSTRISLQFELVRPVPEGGKLAEVWLYSDESLATARVNTLLSWIFLAALLKVLVLWAAITRFGRNMIAAPLSALVARIRELPLDESESPISSPVEQRGDELQTLGSVLQIMDEKLRATLGELRGANQQLEQSNWRLQRAMEQNPAAVTIFDPMGTVLYTNPAFTRISGYPAAEAEIAYRDHLYQNTPLGEHMRRFISGQVDQPRIHFELEQSRPGGELYWAEVNLSPVLMEDGVISHFLCTAVDVTARKRTEQALKEKTSEQQETIKKLEETTNQLLQSEKMASIGQLAAGVAHEINNPIGYVNSNLGTLRSYADDLVRLIEAYQAADNEEGRALAEKLQQELDFEFLREDLESLLSESAEGLDRVKQIIQDLKDFSHADKGEKLLTNLHKGMDSTLNVVWNELKYKCEVVKEYGELPDILCVPSQVNQVFMNLLVNAAHAIEDRGVITIRSGREQERVWIEIEDTGKGINAEHLPRLFDPFFTTKPIGKGTGLGLSVSYGIITKHGGDIEVRSTVGQGTCFRIWLPIDGLVPDPKDEPVAAEG